MELPRRPVSPPRIVAPVASLEQAVAVIRAGTNEVYLGALFDEWVEMFGDADVLTRRQGTVAHVTSRAELAEILSACHESGVRSALTLNARYSQACESAVVDLAGQWAEAGGEALVVADLGLLLALRQRHPELRLHLSLLAGVFNSASVAFFADLGVSRVILPRELRVAEIQSLVAARPDLEYEVLVLHHKCEFIDGLCGFHHATRLPEGVSAAFAYETTPGEGRPVVWAEDPTYEGHGCELPWQTPSGPVRHAVGDDPRRPHCGVCLLGQLAPAVQYLKIAGRGLPTERIVRSIHFVREALALARGADSPTSTAVLRDLYLEFFGFPCDPRGCYQHQTGGEV